MSLSPFSTVIPTLQLAWDTGSYKSLLTCPRQYQYKYILGYNSSSGVDLEFGGYFASAVEVYKKARLEGRSKLDATLEAVNYTLEATWDPERGPWGGEYRDQWRCTGTEPYKNAKGNKAKCPWSHKGQWFDYPDPGACGVCSSPTEHSTQWLSHDNHKDRQTLVRLVVWYCDDQPENADDGVLPYQFPNGTPAVELEIRMPLPFKSVSTGESLLVVNHLDSIGEFGEERFVMDNKTTGRSLNQSYWSQFNPNVQTGMYDLTGSVMFPALNIKGVMIEAAQVLVGGVKFGTKIIYFNDAQREEYLQEMQHYLGLAEEYAKANHWPMNRASCFLCEFKKVCIIDPSKREGYLRDNFEKKQWNPLEKR